MKILIIEDSARLRTTLNAGLRRLGYVIDDTGDGEEGYRYARSYEYDVIILDIMLPTMNGLEILENLRRDNCNVNILILSAKDTIEDRVKGLNFGADDYLTKPFSFDELHARLLALSRRKNYLKDPIICINNLSINTSLRLAQSDAGAIDLTPKEYIILQHMCMNTGKVISSERLLDLICSCNDSISKNAIEAHISAIRRKLNNHNVEIAINTKRGFGYYIDDT